MPHLPAEAPPLGGAGTAHSLSVERQTEFSEDELAALCEATNAAILDGGGFGWVTAQPRAALAEARGRQPARSAAIRLLIAAQAFQHGGGAFRRCCGFAAQHVQEQRQRARPVLQRGRLCCTAVNSHCGSFR